MNMEALVSTPRARKGMSPLIATMLLIAFAVSIGAVIMSYGNAYYSSEGSERVCEGVEIYHISGRPEICLDGDSLRFILINKGMADIDSVHMIASYIGKSAAVSILEIPGSSMIAGFPVESEVKVASEKGELVQVQFVANSRLGGEDVKCFLDPIPVSQINEC